MCGKLTFLTLLFLTLITTVPIYPQKTEVSKEVEKSILDNFFLSASLQTFIAVSKLKDYTQPKPGWRASFGYTFFHQKKHSMPLFVDAGHSVVSGTNPLVRTFDIFPIMVGIGYEWTPISYLTFGAYFLGGMFISNIKHYPTALELLQNKIKTTTAPGGVISGALSIGTNFLEKNVELRASFSLDAILEKPQVIPLPSFQLALRLYPKGMHNYTKRKNKVKIIEKVIEKKVKIKELKKEEEPTQYETIYVYFLPDSAELDINAISQVKKAGDRLKEHSELYILFEGSTAQFGTAMGREKLEAERVGKVVDYLQKNCDIDKSRILYTPKIKEDTDENEKKPDVNYTQYRWVRMRFIRIYFNFNSGEKNVYEE